MRMLLVLLKDFLRKRQCISVFKISSVSFTIINNKKPLVVRLPLHPAPPPGAVTEALFNKASSL